MSGHYRVGIDRFVNITRMLAEPIGNPDATTDHMWPTNKVSADMFIFRLQQRLCCV